MRTGAARERAGAGGTRVRWARGTGPGGRARALPRDGHWRPTTSHAPLRTAQGSRKRGKADCSRGRCATGEAGGVWLRGGQRRAPSPAPGVAAQRKVSASGGTWDPPRPSATRVPYPSPRPPGVGGWGIARSRGRRKSRGALPARVGAAHRRAAVWLSERAVGVSGAGAGRARAVINAEASRPRTALRNERPRGAGDGPEQWDKHSTAIAPHGPAPAEGALREASTTWGRVLICLDEREAVGLGVAEQRTLWGCGAPGLPSVGLSLLLCRSSLRSPLTTASGVGWQNCG